MWIRSVVAGAVLSAGALPFVVSCVADEDHQTAIEIVAAPASQPTTRATLAAPTMAATRPVDYPGLHNVVAYADDVFCGSVPEGEAGFDALAAMGVRTIIDVDGASPNLDAASKRGMRYVHLPIGYSGMDATRTLELARAVRDLPGPLYVHCHHGKHRSAAASGAALVTLGRMTNADAEARMRVSGTAPTYTGLYRAVAVASAASAMELANAGADFPQVYKTSGMVKTMVEIDDATDHLKLIEKAGWTTPSDHPDLVPAAEAGRLADLMRVLVDDHETADRAAEFAAWLDASANQATTLETALVAGNVPPPQLSLHFAAVSQSCKACHVKYRD